MRVIMMGTGAFAEPTLAALLGHPQHRVLALVTNPDRPAGRGKVVEMERPIKKLAAAAGVPVLQPESPNTPEGIAAIATLQPELFVVAAYGHILSKELLAVPPRGGINVHASLLPKYRGAGPIAWAIYYGETETGVTIIRMSPRMDAGEMLALEATLIGPEETAGDLEARLAQIGARLALQVVDQIEAGTESGTPQDATKVTKAPKLTKEHGLIDWSRTAEQVGWQVRAMQPWPTAFIFAHRPNKPPVRLLVLKTEPLPLTTDRQPGEVAVVTQNQLGIACGHGSVVGLKQIQPAGKRAMDVAEFLRGHSVRLGDCLGNEEGLTS